MKLKDEAVIAMAVAAIAEEQGIEADKIRVVSFKKAERSPLEQYIEENNITYRKYRLGD